MIHTTEPRFALPEARKVALGLRGSTSVWDTGPVPESDPPLLLLHGWNIDAPANFGYAVPELAKTRRVVMYDHHGHGQGCRPDSCFSLDDAAADAITVLDQLDIPKAVLVGYSMGGTIAQLAARHAPQRCAGVVLMATAGVFSEARRERVQFGAFGTAAKWLNRLPLRARSNVFTTISSAACRQYPGWILETVQQADPVSLLEAGASLGAFDSSTWIGDLTPPVASVVTLSDTVVSPRRQVELATRARAVHVETVDAGHDLPINDDPRFAAAVRRSVAAIDATWADRNIPSVHASH